MLNELILPAALSVLLLVYSVAANLLPPKLQAATYVPLNLAVSVLLIAWAYKGAGLSLAQIGIRLDTAKNSAVWGLFLGLAIGLPTFLVICLARPRLGIAATSEAASIASLSQLLIRILIMIPLGTVVLEEIAFRGVLPQLFLRGLSQPVAILMANLVFGAWHIGLYVRTMGLAKPPAQSSIAGFALLALAAIMGGILMGLLRSRTANLIGPMIAHWIINALAVIALSLS